MSKVRRVPYLSHPRAICSRRFPFFLFCSALSVPVPSAAQIEWRKADALHPNTYAELLPAVDGVVHTIGTLLEDGSYKAALAKGDLSTLFAAFRDVNGDRNPLERKDAAATRGSYEILNRDSGVSLTSALCLFFSFFLCAIDSTPNMCVNCPTTYVRLSAYGP